MNPPNQNELISSALLKWISLLSSKPVHNFGQLSSGQFYLELLSCAKEFKLVKPIKSLSSEPESTLTLATKVSNIKTIGDSVVRYYQTHLMKDISQMKISYVQLCMGNCEEGIKLFSLIIGIFVCEDGEVLRRFQMALGKLDADDQYIVRALLENTKTIGQIIAKNDQVTLQHKMLNKLQAYEEKIESFELENKDLKTQLQQEKLSKQALQEDIKELKAEKAKLIQKAQVLQVLNSRLESQNSSFILENQNLSKKLESQKRHYDQILTKNQEKLSSYQKEIAMIESMKQKIDELKSVNFQLKEQLTQQIDSSKNQQKKFALIKQNYKVLQENLVKAQTKLSQVELEYQEYRYSCQLNSAMKQKNKLPSSPGYKFSNNSQLSSLKYRMRDRLGSELKGELSQYQMVNSIMTRRQSSRDKDCHFMDSKFGNSNPINGHNLMSSTFDQRNLSNFIINEIGNPNLKDIQNVSEFVGEQIKIIKEFNKEEELLDRSIIMDDEEIDLNRKVSKIKIVDLMDQEQKKEQEIAVMVQMISDLYGQNQWLKRELKKYSYLNSKTKNRTQDFKKKLAEIRKFQPIDRINSQYEVLKENFNANNFEK